MFKWIIQKIEDNVEKKGLVLGVRKFISQCETKIEIKSNREIDTILKQKSAIVVANHHTETDVLAIVAALRERKDIYMIINSSIKGLLRNLDDNLIPVYVNNRIFNGLEGKIKLKLLNFFTEVKLFSRDEEKKKNRNSIDRAIKLVDQGGLVIIFPDGGDQKKDWFSGVGHIIHGIKRPEKCFLMRAFIRGTTDWDILRLLPMVGRIMPKYRVSFAKPLTLDECKMIDPKVTTKYLEEKYLNWISNFNLWYKVGPNYLWLKYLFLFIISSG